MNCRIGGGGRQPRIKVSAQRIHLLGVDGDNLRGQIGIGDIAPISVCGSWERHAGNGADCDEPARIGLAAEVSPDVVRFCQI